LIRKPDGFVLRQNAVILTAKAVKTTNLTPSKKPTVGFFAGRAANEAARFL
jgi:succinyl-CoA synthetase alpha subunit